jgi:hypothetical protein
MWAVLHESNVLERNEGEITWDDRIAVGFIQNSPRYTCYRGKYNCYRTQNDAIRQGTFKTSSEQTFSALYKLKFMKLQLWFVSTRCSRASFVVNTSGFSEIRCSPRAIRCSAHAIRRRALVLGLRLNV